MTKVNATVTNAVVAGKWHGETVQLSKERAERLEALGYVKDIKAVKKQPTKTKAAQTKSTQTKKTANTTKDKATKTPKKTTKDDK